MNASTFQETAEPARPVIRLARRMSQMSPSAVREILKVAERPDVLSFAGGLPAPELFPVEAIAQAHADVLAESGREALQYSTTEGYRPLREWIARRLGTHGVRSSPDQLLVTSGSQQGIDLVARALLEPNDTVVVENPTYLAALQAFASHGARPVSVPSDEHGMQVDALHAVIRAERPRLIYIVPDFHNPKGTTLSLERRRALIGIAQRYGVPILEDDPYGELRFRGTRPPPLAALDDTGAGLGSGAGLVISLGTFSKTLAPGMRIGWLHGPVALVRAATVAKQAADLHTATLSQRAAAKLLETFDYDGHLARLRETYGVRCQAMLEALEEHLPGCRFVAPEGGLFIWAQLPRGVQDQRLFERALRKKVAFVPGHPFFVGAPRHDCIRLNFSNRSVERIQEGMARLGQAFRQLCPAPR
jgi:2-aminoadipate transaminase